MVRLAITKGYLKKSPWLGRVTHVNLGTQEAEQVALCELQGSLVFA